MAEQLRLYDVVINGRTTTMRLTDEDADAYGDAATPVRTSGAKPKVESAPPPVDKGRQPANKARTVHDK